MSQIRLVVREEDRDWSGSVHAAIADRAIAALSADPVTLGELRVAIGRFEEAARTEWFFAHFVPELYDEPYDAGLVVIDLIARLVKVESTYSAPGPAGWVTYHDGDCCTQIQLEYHLADDWHFLYGTDSWEAIAEARRRERARSLRLDFREILYGRPMLEYLSREVLTAFGRREEIAAQVQERWAANASQRLAGATSVSQDQLDVGVSTEAEAAAPAWPGLIRDASPFYDTIKDIHVAWLLTPRDDLRGECPRNVALRWRGHIGRDMEDRCWQWTRLGKCPPGLDPSSYAYRYGGFGSQEWIEYYDLVRELLWSSWEWLSELERQGALPDMEEPEAVESHITSELLRLEEEREVWLDTPDPEINMGIPRVIITRERSRLPNAVSGREAMIDPDCPACRSLCETSAPIFWHLDGCNMDEEFAFNPDFLTREEWEQYCGDEDE